jgi:hypothetical protein
MNPDQGFVDLRLNRQEGQTEESFWPSFTDIMTVIVMIFLLAMVVLLIRNMELVDQLRATMEAEREAAALAQATGTEPPGAAAAADHPPGGPARAAGGGHRQPAQPHRRPGRRAGSADAEPAG